MAPVQLARREIAAAAGMTTLFAGIGGVMLGGGTAEIYGDDRTYAEGRDQTGFAAAHVAAVGGLVFGGLAGVSILEVAQPKYGPNRPGLGRALMAGGLIAFLGAGYVGNKLTHSLLLPDGE